MLRPASMSDMAALATVKSGFTEQEIRARFEWLANINASWHVWWMARVACGWAIIHWDGKPTAPDYPDLSDLYVHPQWRNQGIGTSILLASEQKARELGYTTLGLAVNPELNQRAYALYQRLGYHAISDHTYIDGVYDGVEDWVIDLAKRL